MRNTNSYFTNIGPNLANKIQNVNPMNPLSYLNTLDNNVFYTVALSLTDGAGYVSLFALSYWLLGLIL